VLEASASIVRSLPWPGLWKVCEVGSLSSPSQSLLPSSLSPSLPFHPSVHRACSSVCAQTEEDVYSLRSQVAALEDSVNRLTQEVANAQKAAGDDKLALFRTQSALIAKKLMQKEEALELAQREAEVLAREVEAKVSGQRDSERERECVCVWRERERERERAEERSAAAGTAVAFCLCCSAAPCFASCCPA